MRSSTWIPVLAPFVLGALLTACETSTDPDRSIGAFDMGVALSDYEALERALAAEDLAGFRALAGRTPLVSPFSPGSAARAPIISELHRGATLVYEPGLDRYVADPTRVGALATEGEGRIDVFARHRDGSFRLDVEGDDGMIDGSVELNGHRFATVSGPAEAPTLLGASGGPLTGTELLVLWHIVDSAEDVFDLLEDLLDPVDEVVFLGAVL